MRPVRHCPQGPELGDGGVDDLPAPSWKALLYFEKSRAMRCFEHSKDDRARSRTAISASARH
jgi:hypothetical protein